MSTLLLPFFFFFLSLLSLLFLSDSWLRTTTTVDPALRPPSSIGLVVVVFLSIQSKENGRSDSHFYFHFKTKKKNAKGDLRPRVPFTALLGALLFRLLDDTQ
ncbi:hypothetical protein K457DRAFT_124574 [Linnemannia elongata AG-77]|uniref:Secreted protein n=1 Tax=Linnemannia elongata AG-77 TaxID=1314771 RepID=A0A197K1Y8_9FUNG|nr:hypothetical protein K457DRAFT_124574 [Linnemannia elongata AG-77]